MLLIVRILSDDQLRAMLEVAGESGIDALVEVHDAAELERALALDATLIGVNARDLDTLDVDRERALGLLAAARRGWVEEAVMRVCDFSMAFPAILSAIMLTAVFGAGIVNAIVAIGIYNIPTFARITRASANAVWSREYVAAARACGKGAVAITFQHVLPNISAVLIVQITIRFAIAILAEAA